MLFSLAGIPLTAGFVGKFYVLTAGVLSDLWTLVILLVVSSIIGLYYYLRLIITMYLPAPDDPSSPLPATRRLLPPGRTRARRIDRAADLVRRVPGAAAGRDSGGHRQPCLNATESPISRHRAGYRPSRTLIRDPEEVGAGMAPRLKPADRRAAP